MDLRTASGEIGQWHGMKVVAVSCITNMAAGLSSALLDGTDVVEVASKRGSVFSSYIMSLIGAIKG